MRGIGSRTRKALGTGVVATTVAAVGLGALPAHADSGNDEDKVRRGSCSGPTDWKWKVGPEDGGLEAEFEIDSSAAGVPWRVRLFHDGVRYVNVVRQTNAVGEIEIERRVANNPGVDNFRAFARNLNTDETCNARISF